MNWREKLRALCPLKLDWAPMMPLEAGGARQTSRLRSQMRLHFRQFVAGRKVNLRTIAEVAFFLLLAHTINSLLSLALGRFASLSASARGCPPRRQIHVPNSCKSQRFYAQMEALPSKAAIHSRKASRLAKFQQSMLGHFVLRMRAAIATGSECALAIHASAKLADLDPPCSFSSTRPPVFVASSNGFLPSSKQPVSALVGAVVTHVQLQPPNPSERVHTLMLPPH
jgi:hypothetical protein